MFESDDFDQVLSVFELPEVVPKLKSIENRNESKNILTSFDITKSNTKVETSNITKSPPMKNLENPDKIDYTVKSPKHTKRRIINSYFDHKTKRKFPGPAGILSENLEEPKDESICQIELLSQDIDFTQNNLQRELFESPLWNRLLDDIKEWNIHEVDSIKEIKQQALAGNLRRKKAKTVAAFVECIDRSVIDPLIILRDATGSIKCTLHRDVWSTFSPYLVSEYCALVLWKPTVLTTGSAFKKHYLNITQSNILGIYSPVLLQDNENNERTSIPDGYVVVYGENYTVIKAKNTLQNKDINRELNSRDSDNILDDLDSVFSEDIF